MWHKFRGNHRLGHIIMKHTPPKNTSRIFSLDFIRVFAIVLIVLHHYQFDIFHKNNLFGLYMPSGAIGVSLFIILSGCSLAISAKKLSPFDLKAFYFKRFLSIYPLFWVCYLFAFAAIYSYKKHFPIAGPIETYLLTFFAVDGFLLYKIPNNYLIGEWFLGFIVVLYLLFPFARYCFDKSRILTLGTCLFLSYFFYIYQEFIFGMEVTRFPLFRISEFCMGMMFAYYLGHKNFKYMIFISFALLVAFHFMPVVHSVFILKFVMIMPVFFISLIGVGYLFNSLILNNVILFLAKYSYGAFLLHHVIINVFKRYPYFSPVGGFIIILFLSFLFSFLLTNLTDRIIGAIKLAYSSVKFPAKASYRQVQ